MKSSKAISAIKSIIGAEKVRIEQGKIFVERTNAYYYFCNIISANNAYKNDKSWDDFVDDLKEFVK